MAKLEKLLSLSTKEFYTGVGRHFNDPSSGLFSNASGIQIFGDGDISSGSATGTLMSSPALVQIGAVTVVDTPQGGVIKVTGSGTAKIYTIGSSGHFYSVDQDDVVTDLRSATPITSPAKSVAIYKTQGGTEYLYYWQNSQIGRWDISGSYPTGWTDNHFTGLQSTVYHPVHEFAGSVYYGNLDRIGYIYDNAGTATNSTNVLDFPSDYTVTCLEDDGDYLVAGITKNKGDNQLNSTTKIIFWDTFSPTWNKEYTIPDPTVNALKRIGNIIYALCGHGIYALNFSSSPQLVLQLDETESLAYATPNACIRYNNVVLWSSTESVSSYGKYLVNSPSAYYQNYLGGGCVFMQQFDAYYMIIGSTNALYKSYLIGSGGTDQNFFTNFFDLKDIYSIKRIDVILGEKLASGDSLFTAIKYAHASGGTDVTFSDIDVNVDGQIYRKSLYPSTPCITDLFSLYMTLYGSISIKRIDIYGERVSSI